MYKFDDLGSTYMSLPPNLQSTANECFSYALDRQMKRLHKLAKQLTIWSDLDNVDAKYYDYIALCIKAPYYKSEYTDDVKLMLIKSAIEMHRYAGTQRAIDKLLESVFDKAYFQPWYEYGGEPYHFRPKVFDVLTEDGINEFVDILQKVKAARSIMDAIAIGRDAYGTLYVGAATHAIYNGAKIREAYRLEKDIGHRMYIGNASYAGFKPATIQETYNGNCTVYDRRYSTGTIRCTQNNPCIHECYAATASIEDTRHVMITGVCLKTVTIS